MSRVLEWGLRAWALVLVGFAALWAIGPYGVGLLEYNEAVQRVYVLMGYGGPLDGWATGPVFEAEPRDEQFFASLAEANRYLIDSSGLAAVQTRGDVGLSYSVRFITLTPAQQILFLSLNLLPLLVLAALWWTLAGVLKQSRSESVFTSANARLLSGAGAVIAAGAVLLELARWSLQRWLLSGDGPSGTFEVVPLGVYTVPWPAVATGVAFMVLGRVWRRGVAMEKDLAGLV